jgi:hypothetical protein
MEGKWEEERQGSGRRNDREVGGGMEGKCMGGGMIWRRDRESQGGRAGIHRVEGQGLTGRRERD